MTQIDALPPDQRAVLSLLLRQDKSYEEVARLLRMDVDAVRARAVAAVDALGPSDLELAPERRAEVADYLLRQQPASERASTRRYLKESPTARAWARPVASELRLMAGGRLPELPAEDTEVEEAFGALQERTAARQVAKRSSRTGGFVLLGAVAAIVAAVIVLVINSGGSSTKDNGTVTPPATTSTGASGGTGATGPAGTPHIDAQINLAPADPKSKALAVANVISQGSQRAFALQAQGLAQTKGFAYAVWLYNSPTDALALGFAPAVKADGRMQAVGALPANASHYRQMILTRETVARPARPGAIVLAGSLGLTQ
jgi:hypothetical protein